MAATSLSSAPIDAVSCPSRHRPIDLVYLTRQTLGDRGLEREILGLMRRQISISADRLERDANPDLRQIAHALKGAARNIGAFALSDAAERLERAPGSAVALAALEIEMHRASRFITSLDA